MNKKDNRKRVIVDFKKLTPEILGLLVEKYPEGYEEEDIITFRNAKNELVEAVEVNTEDTKYLIKVSTKLVKTMENYDEDDYEDFDSDDPDAIQDPEIEIEEDSEEMDISQETCDIINGARAKKKKVCCIGTTTILRVDKSI